MSIRRIWTELSREAQAQELATAFSAAAAPPNHTVLNLLDGYSEVSLVDDGENFSASMTRAAESQAVRRPRSVSSVSPMR